MRVPPSEVIQLRDRLGGRWSAITAAREKAAEATDRLRGVLEAQVPVDTSLVVYGSLARREYTDGSDVDWTLLVDGRADPVHRDAEAAIRARLQHAGFRQPTPGGTFGGLTFSHELIHNIGGDDDTNRNTTQRILLLLESIPIGEPAAYGRVIHNILRRYIEEDLPPTGEVAARVPRFLLNDVSRYWRTITVDFAHKRRISDAGWALRTAKLRMSRKLIYVAGLLNCFSCEFDFDGVERVSGGSSPSHVVAHLEALVHTSPLDILARYVLQYFGECSGTAQQVFGAYDEFLTVLSDARRVHLKEMTVEAAIGDSIYDEVRRIAQRFQDGLTALFFERNTPLRDLTTRYGVF
jgi:predicted nucleotidyltransferase